MEEDIKNAIAKYIEDHPEIQEMLEKFQISKEAYDKAIAAISIQVPTVKPTYTLTVGGSYNVNVSRTN